MKEKLHNKKTHMEYKSMHQRSICFKGKKSQKVSGICKHKLVDFFYEMTINNLWIAMLLSRYLQCHFVGGCMLHYQKYELYSIFINKKFSDKCPTSIYQTQKTKLSLHFSLVFNTMYLYMMKYLLLL